MSADRNEVEELKLPERRQLARIKVCAKVVLAVVVVWLLCALFPPLAASESLALFGVIVLGVLFAYVYSIAWVTNFVTSDGRTTKKLIAVAALVLWSVAYVGSYYAMLRPIPANSMLYPIPATGLLPGAYARRPHYRFHNNVVRTVYAPMLWLDQKIRPQYWFMPDAPPQPPAQMAGSCGRMATWRPATRSVHGDPLGGSSPQPALWRCSVTR